MSILKERQSIGSFTVQSLIKENLYTETYRVENEDQQPFFLKLFVLKRMPEKLMNTETGWVKEIEYCQKLKHRSMASFVEQGTIESEESTCQFYLTNYFNGELLADKLKREGPMQAEQAVTIFKSLLEGLDYIHQQGLCHNDITPHNIILSATNNGEPELIDMGHVSTPCSGKTPFDVTDLDVTYSANETFLGRYDSQSDIFSLTAVLYTMLTGRAPWTVEFSDSMKWARKATLMKDCRKEQALDTELQGVDDQLKMVLIKGLEVTPQKRSKDVKEVQEQLTAEGSELEDKIKEAKESKEKDDKKKGGQQPQQGGTRQQGEAESPNKVVFEVRRGGGNGFSDIAGMHDLKEYLSQRVIFVIKNKEVVERYKLSAPNGMLLYGPPGCGKTFVAEKFAEETGFNFILVKASDLGSSFVHGSQEKIAQLFKQAEEQAPVVICFDEFDALVPDRSNAAAQSYAGEVNEFLSQLNNCSKRGIFVVGTTNRPDKIDPAVLRTGRIDKQVYVPLPDREARREMFLLHLKGRPYDESVIDVDRLSELSEGFIASDIAYVVNDAALIAAFTSQNITEELLETSVKNTHPSLRSDTLRMYEEIRQRMEDHERRGMARPKIGFIK